MSVKWIGYAKMQMLEKLFEWLEDSQFGQLHSITNEEELTRQLNDPVPTILFLGQTKEEVDVYGTCADLSFAYPHVHIIVLVKEKEVDYKRAMTAGAVNLLAFPVNEEEMSGVLSSAKKLAEKKSFSNTLMEKRTPGKVITVSSTKGGVGKTTLTVNLATAIAQMEKNVAVIDLDLQFGDAAITFNTEPKKSIYEWLKESYESTEEKDIAPYMIESQTGVHILAAPLLPEFAEVVKEEHVRFAIERLKTDYDYVLIDTPPSLVDIVITAMENSDSIYFVTCPDLPTLKNTRLALDTLKLLQLSEKVRLVLNRDMHVKGLDVATLENVLDSSDYYRIPNDYLTVLESLNMGIPFVVGQAKSRISKSIIRFCSELVGDPVIEAESPRLKKFRNFPLLKRFSGT